jgi:hypothetical protein
MLDCVDSIRSVHEIMDALLVNARRECKLLRQASKPRPYMLSE